MTKNPRNLKANLTPKHYSSNNKYLAEHIAVNNSFCSHISAP